MHPFPYSDSYRRATTVNVCRSPPAVAIVRTAARIPEAIVYSVPSIGYDIAGKVVTPPRQALRQKISPFAVILVNADENTRRLSLLPSDNDKRERQHHRHKNFLRIDCLSGKFAKK